MPEYTPNHIPTNERIYNMLLSLGLIVYGTIGVFHDDIYIPGKRGGLHVHGFPMWLVYGGFIMTSINLLSVVVDHYDKRNNATNYKLIARATQLIGWTLFITALLLDLFFFHKITSS